MVAAEGRRRRSGLPPPYAPASAGTASYVTSSVFPRRRTGSERLLVILFLTRGSLERERATHTCTERRPFELFSARLQVPHLKPVLHLSLRTRGAIKDEPPAAPRSPGCLSEHVAAAQTAGRDECIAVISPPASYSRLTDDAAVGSPSARLFVSRSI